MVADVVAAVDDLIHKDIGAPPCFPSHMLLQWHITNKCNLRCTHCYQEDCQEPDPDFKALQNILGQFHEFLDTALPSGGKPIRGHITVTGGEPFIRPDFPELLDIFHKNRQRYSFAILTNGTLINAPLAKHLAALKPRFIQLSLDGSRETHDHIRGAGNYDRTVASLKRLTHAGITTLVSFTANKANFHEFKSVVKLSRSIGVSRIWADRLVPIGNGASCRDLVLTPQDSLEFFTIMRKEQLKTRLHFFSRTEVTMHRALQFLKGKGTPYHCTAGDTLLTIMPNGDLYPCRRMPVRVGNLFETSLSALYNQNTLLKHLRNQQEFDDQCETCCFKKDCRGGLKCLSYALTGNPFTADPGCPIREVFVNSMDTAHSFGT